MKIILIIFGIITIAFITFQSFTTMATQKTEARIFKVLHTEPEFEIRFYPSATLATVYLKAKSYREVSSPGFRQLAGYIFGGNESETKIAMTTPVQMNINDSVSEMSFVMPAEYSLDKLPKPKDAKVILHQSVDETVAALQFGGFASDEEILHHSDKLKTLLDSKGIKYHGNFRFLAYNPPFQLVGRKNEIIVTVEWPQENAK